MPVAAARTRRARMAVVCAVAALAAQVVVPAMHATVHALERGVARAKADRWHVEGRARGDDGHEHEHDGARHRHEHPGDQPGEHGARAPEHLHALLVPTAAPMIPPPAIAAEAIAAPTLRDRVVARAPLASEPIRGPPPPV